MRVASPSCRPAERARWPGLGWWTTGLGPPVAASARWPRAGPVPTQASVSVEDAVVVEPQRHGPTSDVIPARPASPCGQPVRWDRREPHPVLELVAGGPARRHQMMARRVSRARRQARCRVGWPATSCAPSRVRWGPAPGETPPAGLDVLLGSGDARPVLVAGERGRPLTLGHQQQAGLPALGQLVSAPRFGRPPDDLDLDCLPHPGRR